MFAWSLPQLKVIKWNSFTYTNICAYLTQHKAWSLTADHISIYYNHTFIYTVLGGALLIQFRINGIKSNSQLFFFASSFRGISSLFNFVKERERIFSTSRTWYRTYLPSLHTLDGVLTCCENKGGKLKKCLQATAVVGMKIIQMSFEKGMIAVQS